MIIISNRGNVSGSNLDLENDPDYVLSSIKKNFEVKVDVWLEDNKLYLGSDYAKFNINESFLYLRKLWIHARNISAAQFLIDSSQLNWFYQQKDTTNLTSKGYLWTSLALESYKKTILYMPEHNGKDHKSYDFYSAYGLCTNYPENFLIK